MKAKLLLGPLGLVLLLAAPSSVLPQTAVRQAPVEVVVPEAPSPVVVDGKRVLVYELHVTNFGGQPLWLREVDVYPAGPAREPLAVLRDSALRTSLREAGAIMAAPSDTSRIGVGLRAIVFLWVPLAPGTPVPTALRHRLAFTIADTSSRGTVDAASGPVSVIDSLSTPVSREPVPTLIPPFRGGEWLAGNGPSNASDHRRSIVPLNGKAFLSQRFATDWVMIGPNGDTWHDDRNRAENYWGFGQPVVAVADGEVTEVVDSIADNVPHAPLPPVTVANIAGNHVIVRIGPSRYVMFAHLKRGSVRVRAHQRVVRGDLLGLLGSSGQATAPHLHFQVMDRSSPLAAEGVPYVFDRFTWLGLGRDFEPGQPHPRIAKRRELPGDDAVVAFER